MQTPSVDPIHVPLDLDILQPEYPLEQWERDHDKALAEMVVSNKQLKDALKGCRPSIRRQVYDHLAPQMKFKVKPYWWMTA